MKLWIRLNNPILYFLFFFRHRQLKCLDIEADFSRRANKVVGELVDSSHAARLGLADKRASERAIGCDQSSCSVSVSVLVPYPDHRDHDAASLVPGQTSSRVLSHHQQRLVKPDTTSTTIPSQSRDQCVLLDVRHDTYTLGGHGHTRQEEILPGQHRYWRLPIVTIVTSEGRPRTRDLELCERSRVGVARDGS